MATRKAADKPAPKLSAERRWYEAGILALEKEGRKHDAERRALDEEAKYLAYERMIVETNDRSRRVFDFNFDVDEDSAYDVIMTLSDWATQSDKPITLRMFSPGGDVVSGLAIHDFVLGIREQGVPVHTKALGWAASMASVLLQCGETRTLSPNAFLLIHEERTTYSEGFFEKITDTEDRLKFGHMLEERCDLILAERSTLSMRELRDHYTRKDWWLGAEEAVKLGFADEVGT